MKRISIVGTSGSGKTTLARKIAHRLEISHIIPDKSPLLPPWNSDNLFR